MTDAPAPAADGEGAPPRPPRQPWLHDLVAAVAAPVQLWCGPDGQVRGDGATGGWLGDVRVLSRARLVVGGEEPVPVLVSPVAGGVLAVGVARGLGDPVPDPTVRVERHLAVTTDGFSERVVLRSSARTDVVADVVVEVAGDLARMDAVKQGLPAPAALPAHAGGTGGTSATGATAWGAGGVRASLVAEGAHVGAGGERGGAVLRWRVALPPGGTAEVAWRLTATEEGAVVVAPPAPSAAESWTVDVVADDRRLPSATTAALRDLAGLRLATAAAPDLPFLAAGAPWFLTLFGRDSLWAARMLLPLGTDLAASTLELLARLQGRRDDPLTAEQPGKVLHEVRRDGFAGDGGHGAFALPPLYYGTVDATALWVCLLHDAWRWGMDPARVTTLLPALRAALGWMADSGDSDGDGLLEYVDTTGRGLANQGWKDSGDSVQWADGSLATAPIALCEVQGYAHEAALGGAALLDALGGPGEGDRWRAWAARLADRFRASFWVEDAAGRFPAIALDAAKRPVDTMTSNAGHLLGTGLLTRDEEADVARRLAGPDMDCGRGLRTLSSRSGGFSPLSYHGGSVWAHDTAVVVAGLARTGHHATATSLAGGLLRATAEFADRLPELHGGDTAAEVPAPVPYPAACRPQAWSAASAVVVLGAAAGLRPDVPAGTVALDPLRDADGRAALGAVRVDGLRVRGERVRVDVPAAGPARVDGLPAGLVLRADAGGTAER
ncbi:glycogen debranching N-terminal domain-containing protein [Pseudokineococcus lusitanus]|uniref:Glycogen debranching enzyme n=1 Tax=Pseudokineococcus lusitanus TaxID=763993 RepID=A0A3N1G8V6_9ACTN|nr:glycogen debranching N-terminal domain-containing protein [Pseudokineococcus lusitanus]ROP26680.1 glycogen debranching enzyme [Pseudokineococcus lusitanus]